MERSKRPESAGLIATSRKEAGMSVEELAARSSLSKSTIVNLEAGRRKEMTVRELAALASALDVHPTRLSPELEPVLVQSSLRSIIRTEVISELMQTLAEQLSKDANVANYSVPPIDHGGETSSDLRSPEGLTFRRVGDRYILITTDD